MAPRAVRGGRLCSLVVTFETRSMSRRHGLKEPRGRRKIIRQRCLPRGNTRRELWQCRRCLMTDRTVIELRRIVGQFPEARIYEMRNRDRRNRFSIRRDDVLMYVVRKDRRKLMRSGPDRKRKQRSAPRAGARMTAGAECRAVADKEVAPVTARTRDVSRKLRDVREASGCNPVRRRHFVT